MLSAILIISLAFLSPQADCPIPGNTSKTIEARGFSSQRLSNLYDAMGLGDKSPRSVHSNADASGQLALYNTFSQGILLPLEIEISSSGCISHVGLDLFSESEKDNMGPVGSFIERYLLELVALDATMRHSISEADKVVFSLNGKENPILSALQLQQILNLFKEKERLKHQVDNFTYAFEAEDASSNKFEMRFPANAGLVTGMDKQEMENKLLTELSVVDHPDSAYCENSDLYILSPYGKSLLRSTSKEIHPGLRSEFFFTSEQSLLRDRDYFYESLNNLLLCPPTQPAQPLQIQLKTYKENTNPLNIDLSSIVYYLSKEHTPYAGFAKTEQNEIRGTLVFKNENFDYQHLLIIDNLERYASTRPSLLQASLYLYIRNDNVKNLFGTYLDRQGDKIPVDLNRP